MALVCPVDRPVVELKLAHSVLQVVLVPHRVCVAWAWRVAGSEGAAMNRHGWLCASVAWTNDWGHRVCAVRCGGNDGVVGWLVALEKIQTQKIKQAVGPKVIRACYSL